MSLKTRVINFFDSNLPRATLRVARDIVAAGWVQGTFGGKSVGYCAMGALETAAVRTMGDFPHERPEGAYDKAYDALTDAIGDAIDGTATHNIVDWNDAPGRTQKEVVTAFEKAIKLA